MKIFVICQVRNADKDETARQKLHVEFYEGLGYEVCWPPRDTEQNDPTGLGVCEANFRAIQKANVVHLLWAGGSDGLYFNLGIAFALGKPIQPFNLYTPYFSKSFASMIIHYFDKYGFVGAQLQRLGNLLRAHRSDLVEVLQEQKKEAAYPNNPFAGGRQEEEGRQSPELDQSLVVKIVDYLASHGIHATTHFSSSDGDTALLIRTDMPVSGGEKEHILHMAKSYHVVFDLIPKEWENGAC